MNLYLVRHAWAEERDEARWPDDSQRPLTDDGQKRFKKMLKRLADVKFWPDVIATSPLLRCRQTADLISLRLHCSPTVVSLPALAPGSDLAALIEWTAGRTETDIAWVGHDPDISQFLGGLIGDAHAAIHFKKGAVAAVRFDGPVIAGQGELQWLATAKLLGV